jgi:hypothetical protein
MAYQSNLFTLTNFTFRVIHDFKINYLLLHEDRVRNNNLNRKKKSTLSREAKFISLSVNLSFSYILSTATTEHELDRSIYASFIHFKFEKLFFFYIIYFCLKYLN